MNLPTTCQISIMYFIITSKNTGWNLVKILNNFRSYYIVILPQGPFYIIYCPAFEHRSLKFYQWNRKKEALRMLVSIYNIYCILILSYVKLLFTIWLIKFQNPVIWVRTWKGECDIEPLMESPLCNIHDVGALFWTYSSSNTIFNHIVS